MTFVHAVLRTVTVLLLVMQVSGVAHLASDLFEIEHGCSEPCEKDSQNEECPPFCATCTCLHGRRPVVTGPVVLAPLRLVTTTRLDAPPSTLPSDPDPHGIFHPPRA